MKELTKAQLKVKVLRQEREIHLLKQLEQVLEKIVSLLEIQNKQLFHIVDLHEEKIKEYELKIKAYESKNQRAKR